MVDNEDRSPGPGDRTIRGDSGDGMQLTGTGSPGVRGQRQ